jgi:uncharacterized protein with LGFP repeats
VSDKANQAAWASVMTGLIYNPDTAICKKWLELKSAGSYIGVPVSDEVQEDDGSTRMAFSSGAVIVWAPDQDATLA